MRINDITTTDILITIPATIPWDEYEDELATVEDYSQVMRFKVARLPLRDVIGSRCYLCYGGQIIGWMEIVGTHTGDFQCSTTGTEWSGNFIERSGPLNRITPIPYKGFQGWRYYNRHEHDQRIELAKLINQ